MVDVLVIAPVVVPDIVKTFEEDVVIFPHPALKVNASEDKAPPAIVKPLELLKVRLFSVRVLGISKPVVLETLS